MSLHSSANHLIAQLNQVMNQLKPEEFSQPLEVLSGSSVGQHIRHTLEFFICLIDGANGNSINYDNRKHDAIIEQDVKIAMSVCQSITDFLDKNPTDFDLTMEANYDVEQGEALSFRSSFYRELAYNIEHAIHHMALIKIGVRSLERSILLPDHFGVASSTVRYQMSQK
ncbi:MAG: DinB family protein [Cyclobacteriaceae bacterium]